MGKTVPEVKSRPQAVLKKEVFPNTDRPRLVNNIFIFPINLTKFFSNEQLRAVITARSSIKLTISE